MTSTLNGRRPEAIAAVQFGNEVFGDEPAEWLLDGLSYFDVFV